MSSRCGFAELELCCLAPWANAAEAIGKQTGWGWVVIGVPSMAMMLYAMFRLFKGVKRLTGLDTDQMMLPR